jgi:hypothetical protein
MNLGQRVPAAAFQTRLVTMQTVCDAGFGRARSANAAMVNDGSAGITRSFVYVCAGFRPTWQAHHPYIAARLEVAVHAPVPVYARMESVRQTNMQVSAKNEPCVQSRIARA